MDDQYFTSHHNGSTFDLTSSMCGPPMGFSPSIDANGGLPLTLGNGTDMPSSFLMELQRKRADTVTTLKPEDFEISTPLEVDEDGIEIDIPVRKRALQRLSLTSSIASSVPSTSTSDFDAFDPTGFESESDAQSSASPAVEVAADAHWGFNAMSSLADLSGAFASIDRTPDLVHWRSNAIMQACYYQRPAHSRSASSNGAEAVDSLSQSADFSFAEFIDEDPKSTSSGDESSMQTAVDAAQAMGLATVDLSLDRPSFSTAVSIGSICTSSASAFTDSGPSTPVRQGPAPSHYGQLHAPGLGLIAVNHAVPSMCGHIEPNACTEACLAQRQDVGGQHMAQYAGAHQPGPPPPPHAGYVASSPYQSPVTGPATHNWVFPRPLHLADGNSAHPMYPGQPMTFSQSAPSHAAAPNMAMYAAGLMASPVPSSPAYSARSSSPYPRSIYAMYHGHAGVGTSSSSSSHGMFERADSPMTEAQQLIEHVNHSVWNPYAGLITKRSRGRRVPSKPEEMNNLGKSGKVYTCKVPGCGKCFKRSEHLKRHVRSIHTDDKPFVCPFPNCQKRFSRHDNLNQHARVHATSTQGSSARDGPGSMSQINEDGSYASYGIEMQDTSSAEIHDGGYFSGVHGAVPNDGCAMSAATGSTVKAEPFGDRQ